MARLKGSYLLVLRLDDDLEDLEVGKLGHVRFAAGYYLYVGSAHGSGGLAARLAHHRRRAKAHPHWHIDYLRAHARLVETWSVVSDVHLEDAWVQALRATPGLSAPAPGFGASDSAHPSHLFYSPRRPDPRVITRALMAGAAEAMEPAGLVIEISTHDDE